MQADEANSLFAIYPQELAAAQRLWQRYEVSGWYSDLLPLRSNPASTFRSGLSYIPRGAKHPVSVLLAKRNLIRLWAQGVDKRENLGSALSIDDIP